ncbi:hypothetical protein LWF15_31445 [Kineosporia rhizophila]|uniref:hypothetical protein n=1 Tax=Kineosporia TaxID=49184 RepID=UPI001E61754C|nr:MULTISPECIES: hypothetical protein [Kineosporia]MCE0540019.1 hypothetical protein [Kineosporia rhizophila]GLY14375.1 hypothetical protein Kisp01_13910 [Kineosporia sp. NBRC 101677]
MATGTVPPLTPLFKVGRHLDGLAPALHLAVRLRWLLCVIGAVQGAAPIANGGLMPADFIRFARAGKQILLGRFSGIYADPWMQAGPLELLGSWALFPFDHQHQAAYVREGLEGQLWLRATLGAALVAGALLLVRHLRRVHGRSASPAMELAAGVAAVLTAVPYVFLLGGHLAQFGVALMWVLGASLAVRGRTVAAGVVIGLSAGWEPWGVLAAGLLLTERRPVRLVVGCAAFAVAAVACYLPFVAAGRFEMFELEWAVLPGTLVSSLNPGLDHFSWPLRLLQGLAAGAAGAGAALALGRRPDLIWAGPLAVLLARLLFDPLMLSYYWYPFLIAVVIGIGLLHSRCSVPRSVLVLALTAVPIVRYRFLAGHDITLLVIAAALLIALAVLLRREEAVVSP